jgi:hypothetical protein
MLTLTLLGVSANARLISQAQAGEAPQQHSFVCIPSLAHHLSSPLASLVTMAFRTAALIAFCTAAALVSALPLAQEREACPNYGKWYRCAALAFNADRRVAQS